MRMISILIFVFIFNVTNLYADETPQQFEGFNLSGQEDGKKIWDVQGDTADILGSTIKMTNIIANSYGEEDMHLTAKNGTLDKNSGDMLLENDVVVTTETGATLVTDSLNWDRQDDLITTEDDVVITKERMVAVGTGAEAQPGLSAAQLNEDVTVTVEVEDEQKATRRITITCDGPLEIEYEKQMAIFNNNVVAVDGDRRLLADKVEVFFDADANQITEMICTGNVKIFQGENASYSKKAVYKAVEKRLILSGRPKLIFFTEEDSNVSFGD